MSGIYIEAKTLLENKQAMEWLDGCGATWGVTIQLFSEFANSISNECISFYSIDRSFWQSSKEYYIKVGYTHTPTALEFCQEIARIMGILEPTFGEDKDKAFWDSEQAIIDKAAKNPMVIDPELYGNSEQLLIKGMAIECELLSQDQKKWIDSVRGGQSEWEDWSYCVILKPNGVVDIHLTSESEVNNVLGATITDSPKVFMEYVAQQTGKEYNLERGYNPKEGLPLNLGTNEAIESYKNKIRQEIQQQSEASYPHKAYRILDSLDGIPLDTRIPLSQWIPPFGKKVLLVTKDWFMDGYFDRIESKIIFETGQGVKALNLDGHWMRIV